MLLLKYSFSLTITLKFGPAFTRSSMLKISRRKWAAADFKEDLYSNLSVSKITSFQDDNT